MSAIIAVAALIMFWWTYSAGREVDKDIFKSEDHIDYTIATGDVGTCVWHRGLTSEEMLEVLAAGYEYIHEYNSWEDLVEEHPHVKHYATLPFKFKKK